MWIDLPGIKPFNKGLEFLVLDEDVERDGVGLEGVGARAPELDPVEELERQDGVLADPEQDVHRPERSQPGAQQLELVPVGVHEVAVRDVDEVEVTPSGFRERPVGHRNRVPAGAGADGEGRFGGRTEEGRESTKWVFRHRVPWSEEFDHGRVSRFRRDSKLSIETGISLCLSRI